MRRNRDGFGGRGRSHVVLGSLLVIWGVLALLDSLGFVELRSVLRTFWPLALIAWGLSAVMYGRRRGRWEWGLLAIAVGAVFLGNALAWWTIRVGALWPVLLILIGLRVMFRRRGWRSHRDRFEPGTDGPPAPDAAPVAGGPHSATSQAATLREVAVFGGIERRIASQAFQGGEATAVLGGVQLDLRDSRIAGADAHIEVLAVLGGISLIIPREWAVDSQISAILGGVDDRSTAPVDGSAKRLVLTGQTILGGIEIKN